MSCVLRRSARRRRRPLQPLLHSLKTRRTIVNPPSPPRGRNRNRNARAQDARRRITRSRESSIDSTIFPAANNNNNIVVDNSNIVGRFAERRRIKREQRQEEVSVMDSEDDFEFENLKGLRKERAEKKEEERRRNLQIEEEIIAQMIKKER
jgi:hypothetical protein